MNNDGKPELIITAKNAGYGMNQHTIINIDKTITITPLNGGFPIEVKKLRPDLSLNIVENHGLYFCIATGELCSHAQQLFIQTPLEFKNKKISLDNKSMKVLRNDLKSLCKVDVSFNKALMFSKNQCAKNNLLAIAHDIYLGNLQRLKTDLSYFNFTNNDAKHKLIQSILEERYHNIDEETLQNVQKFLKAYSEIKGVATSNSL